jgi:uncharacterized membrane protein (DUF485 family)
MDKKTQKHKVFKEQIKNEIMNKVEYLIAVALIVIIAFFVVNSYTSNFLSQNGVTGSTLAIISLCVSVIVVGLILGVVQIIINVIYKNK